MNITVTQADWDNSERNSGLRTPITMALRRIGMAGYAVFTQGEGAHRRADIRRTGRVEQLPDDAVQLEHAYNVGIAYPLPVTMDITLPTDDSAQEGMAKDEE